MIKKQIAVSNTSREWCASAKQLAAELMCDYIDDPHSEAAKNYNYLLIQTPYHLGLHDTTQKKIILFYIDFQSQQFSYRLQQAGRRKELLARAMGCKPSEHPVLLDATAGLGRDSFILAALGFEITLIERSAIVHALLKDGFLRAEKDPDLAPIMARMQLHCGDTITLLSQSSMLQRPDVIYLDPMFPGRKKSAAVKKEMIILQNLLGDEEDAPQLFAHAFACAKKRVVVKRPRLAARIVTTPVPAFSLLGRSSRFDIYLT